MTFGDFFKREKHIALNAQPKSFRIAKWIVIILILIGLTVWKGWIIALIFFIACACAGVILHFLLRWKTNGWTTSWGPYKRIPLEGE